jgi:hypothetical protein
MYAGVQDDCQAEVRKPVSDRYAVDERHEQWATLRRRLTGQGRRPRPRLEDLVRAYEAATGTWVCCD